MKLCDAPGCETPLTGKQARYCCPAHKTAAVRARKAGTGTRRAKPSGRTISHQKATRWAAAAIVAGRREPAREPAEIAAEFMESALSFRQRESLSRCLGRV